MSSLSIAHSISSLSTNGDIDSGRGQLGYTTIGSLVGAVNPLWSLTSPYKPHFCVLDCLANSAIQLPTVGTLSTQANVGYRVTVHNKSGTSSIDVQTSTSVSIYVIPPGEVSTFTAINAPNSWDYTTQTASSGATLQTAYDAGNTIIETPNRNVLMRDDPGFNGNILSVQASDTVPLLEIGNSTPGANTPYLKQGYGVLNNPRSNTIYSVIDGSAPYNSTSDDQNRVVLYTETSNREVYGPLGIGLGSPGSSIVKDTSGTSQIPISSSGSSSFNYVGLANTTYLIKYDIIIRDNNAFSSAQVVFTMDNQGVSNTISSPYLEIQNSAAVTVDPIITVVSFGTNGYTISIQGPDYNPPGVKSYIASWLVNQIAYTH